ncbi:hypothetical protein Peur_016657 [Populus x canadensis]
MRAEELVAVTVSHPPGQAYDEKASSTPTKHAEPPREEIFGDVRVNSNGILRRVLFARGSSTSCFKKHCSKSIISGCFCWRGVSATIAHHVAERARRKTGYATQSCGTINCVQALEYLRDRVIICGHGRFHQSIPKRWIWNGPTLLEPLIKLSNLDKNLS